MQIADFDYSLPPERIALYPAETRDHSRLLKLDRNSGPVAHHLFRDLPQLLESSDLLVLNNTRVFPARLLGHRLGMTSGHLGRKSPLRSRIEVLLVNPVQGDTWEALVKPGRKIRVGEVVSFGDGQLQCEVVDRGDFGLRRLRFSYSGNFDDLVDALGRVPLPPYIARQDEPQDRARYQTVYASRRGAVAAPTAGLHFSDFVFKQLREKGINWCEITLHVGLGTFQPIHCETVENHRMEREHYEISEGAASAIRAAKAARQRVIAVGTTTTRVLETATLEHGARFPACSGETGLFIYPGFRFQCIDGLITNFHLPRSTLLMLVSALAGRERVLNAYQQAIQTGYRFYSYGDCMLVL